MHAELIAIGSELLLGEISDTNSTHIARALREIGLEVRWMSAVGDDAQRVAALVWQAAQRSPVVITTGGLGPTVDDPTREAMARAFDRPLEYRPELWAQIEERFQRFRRKPSENNRRQAHVPAGAIAVENPVGTAPAFIVEHAEGVVIALPGVPREMEYLLAYAAIPYLREKFNLSGVIKAKTLRTVGIGESMVDEKVGEFEKLANPAVGLMAHMGQVDVRITATAQSEAEAEALIAPVAAQIRERLGELAIPLAADPGGRIARAWGAFLEHEGVAARATFLVDPAGVVQYAAFHPLAVGRSVSEILRVIEALLTGELAPAEWKPGAPTLGR